MLGNGLLIPQMKLGIQLLASLQSSLEVFPRPTLDGVCFTSIPSNLKIE